MAPVVLGYYDYRCFGQAIRYMLHYLGVEFEDKRYKVGDEQGWPLDKYNLGLEFPNIPYYMDGEVKLTQSMAILRYLARKNKNLFYSPQCEHEIQRFDIVEGHVVDFGMNMVFWAYSSRLEEYRPMLEGKMKESVKVTSKALGKKQWLFGDKISYVDFLLFENLSVVRLAFPDSFANSDNIVKYLDRFAKLPGIKEYRSSSKDWLWPVYGPDACWGGSGEPPNSE